MKLKKVKFKEGWQKVHYYQKEMNYKILKDLKYLIIKIMLNNILIK
jgi:hypothetical protein